jgi:hypothetical protein
VFARGARLIESRKVNRTAMFVFGIGDRFCGTLTANVHEPYAARYYFTSALPCICSSRSVQRCRARFKSDSFCVTQTS